jgi:hypothetical protein
MIKLSIAREFSEVPFGRYKTDGTFSGEFFRDDFLIPKLRTDDEVEVILDGTEGYGSSFLEEAFGGLVRKGFSLSELKQKLVITANDPEFRVYRNQAWKYIEEQSNR